MWRRVGASTVATMHPAQRIASVPRRPTRLDVAIVAALLAWALAEALFAAGPGSRGVRALTACAVVLPLLVRRRHPIGVMVFIGSVLILRGLTADLPESGATPFPSLLVATFSVALHVASLRRAVLAGLVPVVAMAVTLLAGAWTGNLQPGDLVFLVFFVGGTWALGRVVRYRASQADAAASVQAQAAVAAERARIARELHDVVAHSISIVSVQAAAANAYLERDPTQAREHLDAVRRTAHDALGEMRRLCGVLREDAAVLLPQPTLDRVCELVSEARHAGVELELIQEGERHELPPGLDLAAFRILQEALTNVRKHAGAVSAAVRIGYCTDGIDLEVRNAPGAGLGEPGCGHGLEGMRERARVYGGRVDAGVEPDGSFAVRARLPLHGGAPA
jgi:signal transduction histidine kinase